MGTREVKNILRASNAILTEGGQAMMVVKNQLGEEK